MASEIRVNKIANRAGLSTVEYTDTGIIVSGIVTCTEISGLNALNIAGVSTFASPLDINGDIDVDGHTNLDNLSVAGVSTFSGEICLDTHPTRIKSSAGDLEIGVGTTSSFFITGGPYSAERLETTVDCVILYSAGSKVARTHNGRFEVGNPAAATGIGATLSITGGANFAGIVTASSYRGDGSQLTGISLQSTGEAFVILRNQSNPPALSDTGRNIIIGYNAAHKYGNGSATGGNENVFLGYGAGYNQTGGDGNVYVGAGAGNANVTSTGSVYIGQDSGRFATGGDNICIGRFAGNVGGFTGSNNLVFGYNSDPSSANVSNEITLGNANISLLRVPGINLTFGNNGAVIAGVVTATSFSGDGSSLSNLPASAPVGGASTNTVFFENDKAVAVNYQVTSTKNAMSAGPIAINAGIAVTVPSGCSWTIV